MENPKLSMALGLSMRAGKCIAGDFACEKALKSGKAKLILVEDAASDNTKTRYREWCITRNVPYLVIAGVANAVGKPGRMIFAISDAGFVRMIQSALGADKNNDQR